MTVLVEYVEEVDSALVVMEVAGMAVVVGMVALNMEMAVADMLAMVVTVVELVAVSILA